MEKGILVTGAYGSVGGDVISLLVEKEKKVFAQVRKKQRPINGVEIVEGNLDDPSFLRDVLRQVHTVIHTAGNTNIADSEKNLFRANFENVQSLFSLAQENGVEHFIHLSSASIYTSNNEVKNELSATEAPGLYEKSKAKADQWLLQQTSVRVAILRPTIIYGLRAKNMFGQLLVLPLLAKKILGFLPVFKSSGTVQWVHSIDVARAVLFTLEHPSLNGAFNLANPQVFCLTDILSMLAPYLHVPLGPTINLSPLLLKLSLWGSKCPGVVLLLNRVLNKAWREIQKEQNLTSPIGVEVNAELLNFLSGRFEYDCTKLKQTGFEYKFHMQPKILEEMISWYQQNGYIPKS